MKEPKQPVGATGGPLVAEALAARKGQERETGVAPSSGHSPGTTAPSRHELRTSNSQDPLLLSRGAP